MADFGATAALAQLETMLRALDPRVQYFFGLAEEKHRLASGPKVIWQIERGNPDQAVYDRPETDRAPFASDMVQIRARCHGGLAPPTAADPRRVEFDLTEALVSRLRWCVVRRWNGAYAEDPWEVVPPLAPTESGCPIDYVFRVRIDVVSAPVREVVADATEPTFVLEP